MLSFDQADSLLSYDPETGILRWKVSPSRRAKVGSEAGYLSKGYIQIKVDGGIYFAHRIAHLLMTGHWPEGNPEHENRIGTDNRWENIKDLVFSQVENGGNRNLNRNSTSGLKGVCWDKLKNKWRSSITKRGLILLGYFEDPRLAGLTYDAAAKIVWGRRFSHLNFPWEESDLIVLSDRVLSKLLPSYSE